MNSQLTIPSAPVSKSIESKVFDEAIDELQQVEPKEIESLVAAPSMDLPGAPNDLQDRAHEEVLVLPAESKDLQVEVEVEEEEEEEEEEKEANDVVVLCNWMTENDTPSSEDVQRLIDFLFICVDERRLDDVVVFLGAVRVQSDNWRSKYENIRTSVLTYVYEKQGRVLDIDGLCFRVNHVK